ncbi:WbqC family protein, partial [Flavobacteriaceae bacterium]|nr:WbqC family protein [Flavobacteriaceae bacterium]
MSCLLVHPAYFAPIAQYAAILQASELTFDMKDNFQKQTYRNRCYVYGANGKLPLNIPVVKVKGQRTVFEDVQISYAENWHIQH